MSENSKLFEELLAIMDRLRGSDGCPWDRKQSHESLKPFLIEEAYEVLEALEKNDDREFSEELGDLLFQILFHARIATEEGRFTIADVLETCINKMVRRHPHIFGDAVARSTEEVLDTWETIKKEEHQRPSILDGIPKQLPALLKAHRIQERVSRVGFDWKKIEHVFEKIEEELAEFESACKERDPGKIEAEFGDILFSLVNLSRFLLINPEDSLQKTVARFSDRFRAVENELENSGRKLGSTSLEELDRVWEVVKREKRSPDEKQKRQPSVTADIIIQLTPKEAGKRGIILIERKNYPPGWAIPGGFVDYGESFEQAAVREAKEETSLDVRLRGLLGIYSDPGRDPRGHTATAVFIADARGVPAARDDARRLDVFSMDNLPEALAFDHRKILQDYFASEEWIHFSSDE